jgi:inhibitor of cysteine peptidase
MKKNVVGIITIFLFSCNSQKNIKSDIEIRNNETFDISLNSNPSTGYSWKWVRKNTESKVDSISSIYKQEQSNPKKVGVPGKQVWKFKAKEKGIDTLTFEYCRSWEPNSTVETKKIIVKIK